jgi:hypothetical protein
MTRFSEQHEILKNARVRARRRTLLKIVAAWFVVFLVVGGIVYAFLATDLLEVREVRVEGARLTVPTKVHEALTAAVDQTFRKWIGPAYVPFWFFLDTPPSFLAAHPIFRSVEVVPQPLARAVVIRVTERSLYGVWCGREGTCRAFDEDGVVFGEAPSVEGTLITRVTDTGSLLPPGGAVILADEEWRAHFFEILGILDKVRLTPRTITVGDPALREWEVKLLEGPLLKFSFTFVPPGLAETLESLARRSDFRALTYLDFRVRDRLYYK